jgi:hypothetical protein
MTISAATKAQKNSDSLESRVRLVNDYGVRNGSTIFTLVRGRDSGTSRALSFFIDTDTGISNITHHVAKVLDYKVINREGFNALVVSGGGMDMGFKVVYDLSSVLFVGQDRAGYKLNHRWL